jgi:hypothetical protein
MQSSVFTAIIRFVEWRHRNEIIRLGRGHLSINPCSDGY